MPSHLWKRLSRRIEESRLCIATIAGTQYSLHWSFLVALPVWIVCDIHLDRAYPLSLCIAVGLILSLLLHELGHAIAARCTGIVPREISLSVISGSTSMDKPRTWKQDFLITAAGPAVTFFLVIAFSAIHHLFPNPTLAVILVSLCVMNLGLLLFNMLPIFPMDGGRLMRSLLAGAFGDAWSDIITSLVGILLISAAFLLTMQFRSLMPLAWLMILLVPNSVLLRWGLWWVIQKRNCGVHPWATCPCCTRPSLNRPIVCEACGVPSILFDAPCWNCHTLATNARCWYCRKTSPIPAWAPTSRRARGTPFADSIAEPLCTPSQGA